MQTRLVDLVLNLLRKAQYQGTTPSADELYFVTDDYGVTSADVINALGYTPYNATNPNGYTSNVGTVTSVNGTQPDANGNVDVEGLYDYYTIDANIVGTPTVNNYVVSDFTSSNYVQMGDTISIPSRFWEFQVKFTTGDTVPTAGGEFQYITSKLANTTQYGITIFLDGANPNKISFTIGSVSSGVDVTISPNTTYTVKVVTGFTNEYAYDMNAHLYVYNEAGTLLNSWSGSPSVTPSDLYMKFGTDGTNNFDGSIDFENTYINSIELSTDTLTGTPTREWTSFVPIIDTKANTFLSNVSNAGNVLMAHNAMPSNTRIALTLGASGTHYIAPADGWFICLISVAAGTFNMFNNSVANGVFGTMFYNSATTPLKAFLPVKKGDEMVLQYVAASTQTYKVLTFVYAQGSVSEAS